MFIFLLALNCLIFGGWGVQERFKWSNSSIFRHFSVYIGKALNQNRHMLYSVQYVIQNFLTQIERNNRNLIRIIFLSGQFIFKATGI